MDLRVAVKTITVLLALGAELHQQWRGVKSLTQYATSIQHLVNTTILRTRTRQKQWWLYLGKKNDTILKVSLSNKKARHFMDNIGNAIDYIFQHDAGKRNIWHTMIDKYHRAIRILRKKSKYTDNEIHQFQDLIDDFFMLYIEEAGGGGKEGVTNYLHMLSSGHIQYYRTTHRNLYKFSQQGWVSLAFQREVI
jgi:hypothetical protein